MEWLDNVDEARYYVEETLKNEVKIDEVGDILDTENKLENLDCEEEGIDADPMYEHLDRGDHSENELEDRSER